MILLAASPATGQITHYLPMESDVDSTLLLNPELGYDTDFDVGVSRIENADGERNPYFATALLPEFTYGLYSAGLLFKLHYNLKTRATRKEDYDTFSDFLSIIRYVQYAEKREGDRYARFGELEDATLGYGQFINVFRNSLSLDNQKRGLEGYYRLGNFQIEAVYSNVLAAEVYGFRGSYKPYIEKTLDRWQFLDVGISFAGDISRLGAMVNADIPGTPFLTDSTLQRPGVLETPVGVDAPRIAMMGVDFGLPLLTTETSQALAYLELSRIFHYGAGASIGVIGEWKVDDNVRVQTQLEQRLLGKEYLANYFNALYEVERFRLIGLDADGESIDALNTKQNLLHSYQDTRIGSYVSMSWRFRRGVQFTWSYEYVWNQEDNGWFHLDARVKSKSLPIYLKFSFDQVRATPLQEQTDTGRSITLLRFDGAYQFFKYLMLGFGFRHSYEPVYDRGIPTGLKRRRRVEPRMRIVIPL
ncbi:MAG: hypothetical protein R2834_20700 [Rhodothermales bacterium]